MAAACPWCSAPRDSGPTCPRCGALYAKAEQIKAHGRAVATAPAAAAAATLAAPSAAMAAPAAAAGALNESGSELEGLPLVEDPLLEWKLCVGAIPIALCLALLFHFFTPFLQRNFLGMPIHELGHATAAWFCGHWAIPTLWKTQVGETRGFVTPLLLLGAIGYMMYRAWLAENRGLLALGGVLILLQAFCTLVIKPKTADMLIVWGGDGVGIILATVLMATFFFGKRTQLYRGSLRWGFVVIGAAAFVDMYSVWWAARTDFAAVPFGEMEGVGLSDATKLVDEFGWDTKAMVRRYVTLGACCLAALALVYAWGVRQARRACPAA